MTRGGATVFDGELSFRAARLDDLSAVIDLLKDDVLGSAREGSSNPPDQRYVNAFHQIDADKNNQVLIAIAKGRIVGCLQLTFIPSLTRHGSLRAQIEGVRTASTVRGQGLGKALLQYALRQAEEHGCSLAQLAADQTRTQSLAFYQSLGFVASHVGLKLELPLTAGNSNAECEKSLS